MEDFRDKIVRLVTIVLGVAVLFGAFLLPVGDDGKLALVAVGSGLAGVGAPHPLVNAAATAARVRRATPAPEEKEKA